VDVAFEKIFMIDDSDGFPSGAGDMNFAFFVNAINVLGPGKRMPQSNTMDFPTGQTKTFDIFKTLEDPADNVTVRVNGSDQDDCGDVVSMRAWRRGTRRQYHGRKYGTGNVFRWQRRVLTGKKHSPHP
jgi:hypothetical protein